MFWFCSGTRYGKCSGSSKRVTVTAGVVPVLAGLIASYAYAMKLIVRNMSRQTTEAELKDLFESFGAVQSCAIVADAETGASKGFGFIEMPKAGEAKAAIHHLNAYELDGERIRVKRAT